MEEGEELLPEKEMEEAIVIQVNFYRLFRILKTLSRLDIKDEIF